MQSKHLKFGGRETEVNLEAARGFSLLVAILPGKERIEPYAGVCGLALSV